MLAYTFNIAFFVKLDNETENVDFDEKRIFLSLTMGIMYTALILTLGHGNNGGHFNPAITIAILL